MKTRDLARCMIEEVVRNALETARYDLELAQRQAMIAKRISMKYRVRLPYEIKQLFCKRCKRFIVPGINSRVRIGRSGVRAIRITCLECSHIYRKIMR